eukprot:1971652-Karenia_brevis.AAC.1
MTQSAVTYYGAKSLGRMLNYFDPSTDNGASNFENPLYSTAKEMIRRYGLTLLASWGTVAVQAML